MPRRSQNNNQGCCLLSLILWPFQLLENLFTSSTVENKDSIQRKNANPTTSISDRFVDVMSVDRQKYSPSIGVTINYESRGEGFIKDAQKLRNKTESFASHVPFKCYWPTYSDMNGWQQQWYFYWRSQVRRDKFPPTDLSYIFLHVYEILNLVEIPDPIQAAAQLRKLWLTYREKYPNLDRYLPDWGGDLLAIKVGGLQALEWWETILSVDGLRIPDPVINTIVEKAIRTNGLDKLPYRIWSLLSDYQPRNKFYQKYNKDHFVDLAYEKAIRISNNHYLKVTGKSLIDQFVSDRTHNFEKRVFTSAVIGFYHPTVTRLATGRDYAGSVSLANSITSIMKYAENILRKQQKFSAKLSGIELPSDLAQNLDQAFLPAKTEPKQPEPIKITLDSERVASLHQESRTVSEMLTTDQHESEKELLTDLNEARELWKSLNHSERSVLAGLLQRELMTVSQVGNFLGVETEKAVTALEAINRKSLSTLGDKMIYTNASKINLAEDFIDELEVIVVETPVENEVSNEDNISNLWAQFFDALEPVEVEITKILGKSGQMDEGELNSITRAHNAMGNAVMDSLNEKAQGYLNQLPFYHDQGYWLVEEEYLPILREYLGVEVN